MKKEYSWLRKCAMVALCLVLPTALLAQFNWKYTIEKGKIITEVPQKPKGQETALQMVAPKLPVVRVAFVGLGMRGPSAVERWMYIPGIQVVALCDYERDRAEACQRILKNASMPPAAIYSGEEGYKEVCKRKDVDLVYIATDWEHHFKVAEFAMKNNKHAAIEVPSAMNMHEIWSLINLSETTRKHCVMLENCCYDFFELNALNMAQKGVFGEVIYAQGAYRHELSSYWKHYWKTDANDKLGWRLRYNKDFRGDVYATHGLGPIAQVLNIHRGDKMNTLIAMDTQSFNGKKRVEEATGEPCGDFQNGDQTTTLVRTEKGKVIEIHHNVMTPQPYNRMYQLTGTEGFANKYPIEGYAVSSKKMSEGGLKPTSDNLSGHEYLSKEDREALEKQYESELIKKYGEQAKEVGGHGGMDFIMDSRLVYCLQNGLTMDIDVYDLAEWCCFAELGAMSMNNGNLPVEVPDFTRGAWNQVKGYTHAYALPEQEAETMAKAKAFTEQLKAKGKQYWEALAKKEAKKKKK